MVLQLVRKREDEWVVWQLIRNHYRNPILVIEIRTSKVCGSVRSIIQFDAVLLVNPFQIGFQNAWAIQAILLADGPCKLFKALVILITHYPPLGLPAVFDFAESK